MEFRYCVGYEYYPEDYPDIWNKKICNLKKYLNGFVNAPFVTAGKSFYVCSTSQYTEDHAAIGQNIRSLKVHSNNDIKWSNNILQASETQACLESCLHTAGCVGFSFTEKSRSCLLKSNIEYFQYERGSVSGQACFRPMSFTNMSVSKDDVLVSESPVRSLMMSPNSSLDCGILSMEQNERDKREIEEELLLADSPPSLPNIDFLLNPQKKLKRNDYEELVMKRLLSFFQDRNSSMLYPNLFRLLWYTKIPCFDLFNISGDHAHVLKGCQWSGEQVPCEDLFQVS